MWENLDWCENLNVELSLKDEWCFENILLRRKVWFFIVGVIIPF